MEISTAGIVDTLDDIQFDYIVAELERLYPNGVIPILSGRHEILNVLLEFGYTRRRVLVNGRFKSYLIKEGTSDDEIAVTITRWTIVGFPIDGNGWLTK